jgi:hypothetical protein
MLNQREARCVSGTNLIPDGDHLFSMELNQKMVMQIVTVFKNLSSPLILGIDAIDNLGITYLLGTRSFRFQEELNPETFQKADPRVVNTLKILAHTEVPVELGTTINNSQK